MIKKLSKSGIVAGMTNAMALAIALCVAAPAAQAQPTEKDLEIIAAGESFPFIDNAKVGAVFRTAYFDRRTYGNDQGETADANAMGIGGWLTGTTGELWDVLSFGATYYLTLPLYAPDDVTGSSYILRFEKKGPNNTAPPADQTTVSVLGELYAKMRFGNNAIKAGRQEINNTWYMPDVVRFYNTIDGSMVGRYDIRGMQPINFGAVTAQGRLMDDTLRYYGGYIWSVRGNAQDSGAIAGDNRFQSPAEYNGFNVDTGEGGYGGVQFRPTRDSMVEGSYYSFSNLIDMAYLQGDYVLRLEDKNYVRVAAQYFWQGGNGDNLFTGGKDFSTYSWALYSEVRLLPHAVPYISYGQTSSEQQIRSPWAIGPHYATHRIKAMPIAGEHTLFVGTVFDFGPYEIYGLSFDLAYANRTNRQADFNGPAQPRWQELSTDLVYVVPGGFFKNTRVRARWAEAKETGATLTATRWTQDIRFDVSIPFTFF